MDQPSCAQDHVQPDEEDDSKQNTPDLTSTLSSSETVRNAEQFGSLSPGFGSSGWGSLHGHPCLFDDFLDIERCEYGKYDLVDGVLEAHPMADDAHAKIVDYLFLVFHDRKTSGQVKCSTGNVVAIPGPKKTFRRPDLTVGVPSCTGKIGYPEGNPPLLVVEVTSGNRDNDVKTKMVEYALAGIMRYIIVDRDTRHKHLECHAPCVFMCSLKNGAYEHKIYRGSEVLETDFFGAITPVRLLEHASPTKAWRVSKMRQQRETEKMVQLMKKIDEQNKKIVEQNKRADEQKKTIVEQNKRADEQTKRARKYKKKHKKAGYPVSDSSPSSSPPKKRVKSNVNAK